MVRRYEETVRFHPVVEVSYLLGLGVFVAGQFWVMLTEPKRICAARVHRFLLRSQEPEHLNAAIGKP